MVVIMKKKFLITSLGISLLIAGCSSNYSHSSSAKGKLERWTTFDGKTVSSNEMGDRQAKVYFYREQGSINGPAVNVFVDGDYLASILDGGYREATVCSTGEQLLPSFTKNTGFADRDTGVDYNFVAGETAYIKIVSDQQGQPIFQRVEAAEGAAAINNLAQQTQTLPRTKPNRVCKQKVIERIVLEKFNLQASSLFKFDRSDYANMLPKGKQEIQKVGQIITSGKFNISDIKVVGYTDPMGTEAYNMALSKRRAATVKQALKSAGVNYPIMAEGLGERNLLVRDCLQKHGKNRKARMACDQPNRRVEIIIYGTKKKKEGEIK